MSHLLNLRPAATLAAGVAQSAAVVQAHRGGSIGVKEFSDEEEEAAVAPPKAGLERRQPGGASAAGAHEEAGGSGAAAAGFLDCESALTDLTRMPKPVGARRKKPKAAAPVGSAQQWRASANSRHGIF